MYDIFLQLLIYVLQKFYNKLVHGKNLYNNLYL